MLSAAEKNYSITELETLAVVWGISHFRVYLYGCEVKILTDHSAVKTILEAPNLSGKHARWWLKVFGCGIGKVQTTYRPGKENDQADALSRSPVNSCDAGEVDLDARVTQVVASKILWYQSCWQLIPCRKVVTVNFILSRGRMLNCSRYVDI